MRHLLISSVILTTLSTTLCAQRAETEHLQPAKLAGLKEISGLIGKAAIPGLSFTQISDGKIVYSQGFGVAQGDRPVDTDTVFCE